MEMDLFAGVSLFIRYKTIIDYFYILTPTY